MANVKLSKEIEEIQKEHNAFLSSISVESFLKIRPVSSFVKSMIYLNLNYLFQAKTCILTIFNICHRFYCDVSKGVFENQELTNVSDISKCY